jgi:hypothetical protein
MKTKHDLVIENLEAESIALAVSTGGPGWNKNRPSEWVVARDRKNSVSLVGGLGCMGVGKMWLTDNPYISSLPTYADALEFELQ